MSSLKARRIYLFFFICILAISCRNNKKADISKVQLKLNIQRFDESLKQLNSSNLSQNCPKLEKQYGHFYRDFMSEMISLGSTSDTSYYANLRIVLTDPDYKALQEEVAKVYPDFKTREHELTDAFKHLVYYFPRTRVPRIVTFFSGFSNQIVIGNDYLGIGLDLFLGAGSKFYPALRETMPYYIARRFTPQNIAPRVVEAFVREEMFPEKDDDVSLLSRMVYNGKIMYLMDAAMPELDDSLKIGYTTKQMAWSRQYEQDIWAWFLNENLLYETDYTKIQKYLTEAPFTPGLGVKNESAPKLGIWLGWQIVKHYMERNPDASLQQLMDENDAQKILNTSKYKP